ncbi:unnamed protein product [Caenorhabditis sp. 36 PRJEB53466]|nr:unnamed protein product [Caenorhabditis sp. 36 PRJEB53466]
MLNSKTGHGMPRRFRIVDWILLIVILFAVYTILNYDGDGSQESTSLGAVRPSWNKEDIREMCQFLEQEVTGEEGDQWVKGNDYEKQLRLRGITVVFRHGERSPVSKVNDEIGCLPHRDVDRKAFVAYKELAESDELLAFLKVDPRLNEFPRVPEDAKCISGMLTAEGALQHLKLGRYFRHRYERTQLFSAENQRIVTDVITSKYNRTVQSALAFSTEFLYKQRTLLAPIQIKASNFSYHCLDDYCACKQHKAIRKMYEKEHLQEFYHMKSDSVADEEKKLLSFSEFSSSFDPFQMIDVGLGRFICRRKTLPCHENECLTFDSFNK